MLNISQNSHTHSIIEHTLQYQNGDVVAKAITKDPLTLQNDKVDITKDKTSDNNSLFSHNRHSALKAYLQLHKEAKPILDEAKSDCATNALKDCNEEKIDPNTGEKVKSDETKEQKGEKSANGKKLNKEEQAKVDELKDRDNEVRVHENAHKAAGGHLASAPVYEYETGPDGKRYVVNGHVDIDVSEESDPHKTIEKMQRVRAAAYAPAEPSGADRQVAAEAAQKEMQAKAQLREHKDEDEDKEAKTNKVENTTSPSKELSD